MDWFRARPEEGAPATPVAPEGVDLLGRDPDPGRAALLGGAPAAGQGHGGRVAHNPAGTPPQAAQGAADSSEPESPGAADETPPVHASLSHASRRAAALLQRDMFRVSVNLPANLDVEGQKLVPVRITNISGTGAALLVDRADPVPETGHWLDLALPNRAKELEIQTEVIQSRPTTGSQGQPQHILHVRFPSIRRNEQDAIIAYINNIRLYEDKQYTVAAQVILEVVTGRRRFAKFSGETMEIRPDQMKLLMDDFDAIVGAEVMLTVMAPHFADHLDVDDVKIDKVDIVGPRKAEVEVTLGKPDDKVLLFIRKHYPGVAKTRK